MNQDGNTGISNNPDFSSQDKTPNTEPSLSGAQQGSTSTSIPDFFNRATENVVIYNDDVKPGRKRKIVAIIAGIVALVVIGIISTVCIVNGIQQSRAASIDAAKKALLAFQDSYSELLADYEWVDVAPLDELDEKINGPSFFLAEKETIELNRKNLSKAQSDYEGLKKYNYKDVFSGDELTEFEKTNKQTGDALAVISYNIDLLEKFYGAYTEPAYSLIARKTKPSANCPAKSDEMKALENNETTAPIAQSYYQAYCRINYALYAGTDLDGAIFKELTIAKTALARNLKDLSEYGKSSRRSLRTITSEINDEK